MKNIANLLLAGFIFGVVGCASTQGTVAHAGGAMRERSEGYSLLYKLVSDESEVSKILILKHANEPLAGIIKEISQFMQSTKKQMDEFPKTDAQIEYDVADLPKIEQRGRQFQEKDERNGLLFSSGEKFEVRLIFTQAEATNYATQLAKSLIEIEDNPARKSFLNDVAQHSEQFHDRLMALLSVRS